MPKRSSPKPRKPTLDQAAILKQIAQSRLVKTLRSDKLDPEWHIDGNGPISHECAKVLIMNGWVIPQRDGLPMFEETQSYAAKKP